MCFAFGTLDSFKKHFIGHKMTQIYANSELFNLMPGNENK